MVLLIRTTDLIYRIKINMEKTMEVIDNERAFRAHLRKLLRHI